MFCGTPLVERNPGRRHVPGERVPERSRRLCLLVDVALYMTGNTIRDNLGENSTRSVRIPPGREAGYAGTEVEEMQVRTRRFRAESGRIWRSCRWTA